MEASLVIKKDGKISNVEIGIGVSKDDYSCIGEDVVDRIITFLENVASKED